MERLAVTIIGRDRMGIVAEVTGALFQHRCSVEETSMTRLRSQFAMMLLVCVPDGDDPEALGETLRRIAGRLDLEVVIRRLAEPDLREPARRTEKYGLRVYGSEQPEIVHAVTSLLFRRGLNVTDLNARTLPGAGGPVYVLLLEVEIPSPEIAYSLRPELERLAPGVDVDICFGEIDLLALEAA